MENPEEQLPDLKKTPHASQSGVKSIFLKSAFFFATFAFILWALSWSFGWIAVEKYSPDELFDKYQSSRPESRPLILVEWMRVLSQHSEKKDYLPTPLQEDKLRLDLQNLNFSENTERNLAAPLISLLGFSTQKEKTLQIFLDFSQKLPLHQGLEAQIALIFGVGRLEIWNSQVQSFLESMQKDSDASVRKSLAYILGAQKNWPRDVLKVYLIGLLNDQVEDVHWNAALSIYRLGFPDADPFLLQILQKTWEPDFANRSTITLVEEQLYSQVFATLKNTSNETLKNEVQKLAKNHPHVKLRRLALEALTD